MIIIYSYILKITTRKVHEYQSKSVFHHTKKKIINIDISLSKHFAF